MNVFQLFITCKRTNNANNATHYVKLGKKRREISKRNYYIISPRMIIKAIIIIFSPSVELMCTQTLSHDTAICDSNLVVCRDVCHSHQDSCG